ncbi:MAG: hypothetical protein RL136_456 [Planctomycetota bacterium]
MHHDPNQTDAHSCEAQPSVLIWDGDRFAAGALRGVLSELGFACTVAETLDELVASLRRDPTAVSLLNLDGRERELAEIVQSIRSASGSAAVVAMGGSVGAARAIEWIRAGASDVLLKPFGRDELAAAVGRARTRAMLEGRSTIARTVESTGNLGEVVGSDPRLAKALELARAASRVRSNVLIHGESGTGKTLLARAIHRASERAAGPFIEVACGSIPETLLESELFGHVKGAFTGAIADKKGRFLAAHGGTLFLDEINSATPLMQLKLLRVLQERKFEPVGSDETVEVDVRLIVASNQSLERLVEEGRFRQDLFYRVHVLPIELPPLRERPQDTLALAEHFLRRKSAELGRTILGFDPEATALLRAYAWPGNVRELENAVERGVVMSDGAWISPEHLPERVRLGRDRSGTPTPDASRIESPRIDDDPPAPLPMRPRDDANGSTSTPRTLADAMRDPERDALLKALGANNWNRTRTARSLGIDRTTLYRKMRDLGLNGMGESA